MKETTQRLRSLAPPTRDKIIIWSAIIAGCGIMALLGRTAAIHRFGTDEFTGNILFAVFFVLTIGLYLGFQSVIDDLFCKLPFSFHRKSATLVAETPDGDQIAIETSTKPDMIKYSADNDIQTDVLESDVEFDDECYPEDEPIDEYGEASEADNDDELLDAYLDSLSERERDDFLNRITRVKKEPEYGEDVGCFTTYGESVVHHNPDGTTLIEEYEHDCFLTADGAVYSIENVDEMVKFYEKHHAEMELHNKLINQHHQCNAAHDEVKEEDLKFSLAQIEFLCAYITQMMQPYLEAEELQKLHHNAKVWTINAMPPFSPVNLRSDHLTKEDLKHLGYNVGKFLRLRGEEIARFVKKVFEKPFENTHIRTIVQKLRESKSTKERIPIHTADQMDKLFEHFKRYGNINLKILQK